MGMPLNEKCMECAKSSFDGKKPDCYKKGACEKKKCYYRNLDHYRMINRRNHHYIKYAGDKCAICSSVEELQAHHIEAQINGGEHTRTNIMTLCDKCHHVITRYYQAIRGIKQLEENPK